MAPTKWDKNLYELKQLTFKNILLNKKFLFGPGLELLPHGFRTIYYTIQVKLKILVRISLLSDPPTSKSRWKCRIIIGH